MAVPAAGKQAADKRAVQAGTMPVEAVPADTEQAGVVPAAGIEVVQAEPGADYSVRNYCYPFVFPSRRFIPKVFYHNI